MAAIDAKARNVRELLGGKKYAIDYFQREYRWQTKQVAELVSDPFRALSIRMETDTRAR